MNTSQIYIAASLVALAIIAFIIFFVTKKNEKHSALSSLAFFFVLAGMFFGEKWLVGYGLIGVGILLALIDIIKKFKKNNPGSGG